MPIPQPAFYGMPTGQKIFKDHHRLEKKKEKQMPVVSALALAVNWLYIRVHFRSLFGPNLLYILWCKLGRTKILSRYLFGAPFRSILSA